MKATKRIFSKNRIRNKINTTKLLKIRNKRTNKPPDLTNDKLQYSSSPLLYDRPPVWRGKLAVICFGFLFSLLAARALFLATNPVGQIRAAMVVANSPQDSLAALVKQADKLENLTKNIESVSILALKEAMNESASAAQQAAKEFYAQSKAWSELRGKIRNDSSTYDELRKDLSDLKRLQDQEILRLKRLIEEAQRPSIIGDAWNLFFSFLVGVIGSVLASGIYEKIKSRKTMSV